MPVANATIRYGSSIEHVAVGPERLLLVAIASDPGVVAVPRDEVGVVLACDLGHDLPGVAASDEEVTAALAVPRSERSEGVEQEGESWRARVGEHGVVEDEQRAEGFVRRSGPGHFREADVVRRAEVPAVQVDGHGVRSARRHQSGHCSEAAGDPADGLAARPSATP